jgi:hypothetical protein
MTTEKIEWEQFCDRAAAMMRGVLEDKVTLDEASDFFEKDKSISDPDLRGYVEYIIFEFGGSPGYYQKMIDLFEKHATEKEMVQYLNLPTTSDPPLQSAYDALSSFSIRVRELMRKLFS